MNNVPRCTVHGAYEAEGDCVFCDVEIAQEQARLLAEAIVASATLAPGPTRWPRFSVPADFPIYAIVAFGGETIYEGGATVEQARDKLLERLLNESLQAVGRRAPEAVS